MDKNHNDVEKFDIIKDESLLFLKRYFANHPDAKGCIFGKRML